MDLNAIFRLSDARRVNAYTTCRSLLTIARYRSPSEAISMMKASARRLAFIAAWIPFQKRLERRVDKKNLQPSASFMRAFLQRPASWINKLDRMTDVLPKWCIAKLMESGNLRWIEQPVSATKEVVMALEEWLKMSMSEELAVKATFVCISNSPSVLENSREQLQRK